MPEFIRRMPYSGTAWQVCHALHYLVKFDLHKVFHFKLNTGHVNTISGKVINKKMFSSILQLTQKSATFAIQVMKHTLILTS